MLNKSKVLQELQATSKTLFLDISYQIDEISSVWDTMVKDKLLLHKVQSLPHLGLATWVGSIDDAYYVEQHVNNYQVVSVDGSQVYPDKHTGTHCFLINIGGICLTYQYQKGSSFLWSEPFVFAEQEIDDELGRAIDVVNGKREEFEFKVGLEHCLKRKNELLNIPLIFLFDGSLVFWHLQGKDSLIKDYFLQRYIYYLDQFYKQDILIAGYLSLSKGRDLSNIVQAFSNNFASVSLDKTKQYKNISDGLLATFFLKKNMRSTIFKSNALITQNMPFQLHPHFFYYNTGDEIVRIEIPGYIACDEQKITLIASLIKNQIEKGQGYPIAIAEAHEQAVVKSQDRNMFYQMVKDIAIQQKRAIIPSQKNIKKRRMNV